MSNFNYSGPRYAYQPTRSGMAYLPVPERPRPAFTLPIKWYAPKPEGHYSIEADGRRFFKFGCRFAWLAYIERRKRGENR